MQKALRTRVILEQIAISNLLESMKKDGKTEISWRNPKTGDEVFLDLNDMEGSLKKLQERKDKK